MFAISVKSNIDDVIKSLDDGQRRQVPFAISRALNATAFDAQRAVKKNLHKTFTLRSKWTERGVRVIRSNKQKLVAVVLMGKGREYMGLHEFGGTRRAANKHIAIPEKIRRTKRSKISKARRPRSVLNRANTFKIEAGQESHLPPGIYQRMARGRLKMLYAFETSTTYKKVFNFDKTIEGVTNNRFDKHFTKFLAQAMRTAR